jgi:GNAT superfamily N-acetyltransferase
MTSRISEWRTDGDVNLVLDGLAELLHATVHDGASVGFVLPFTVGEARALWSERVLPAVRARERRVLLARLEGRIVGTVQLVLDTMPNQRHRADVAKLLVHPKARRRGIARELMERLEGMAREEGRTLLTLDTRTGDAAEPLYLAMGYRAAGVIPGYARGPAGPELEATTFMYKVLG